jgi:hypothetical protein
MDGRRIDTQAPETPATELDEAELSGCTTVSQAHLP